MKLLVKGIIFFIVLSLVSYAYAADTSAAAPTPKHNAAGMKAERGVKNILFGWTDIPRSIIQVTRDSKNPIWGLIGGSIKGLGKALPRTVSGIADVVTFPIGDYDRQLVKPDAIDTKIQ